MGRHGENIRKRNDGRWEGRYKFFDEGKGRYIYRSVYGRAYEEAKAKLSKAKLENYCQEELTQLQQGETLQQPQEMRQFQQLQEGWLPQQLPQAQHQPQQLQEGFGVFKKNELSGETPLFSQAAEGWLREIMGKRKHSTYVKYDTVYRTHLAGAIGSCQLSTADVQEMGEKIFDHLLAEGLSDSLQKSICCIANQILDFANRKYSAGIPLLERPPVKIKRKAAKVLSKKEQARLFSFIYHGVDKQSWLDQGRGPKQGRGAGKGYGRDQGQETGESQRLDKFKIAVLLCLYTGLRLGELCALKWSDLDFDSMCLAINRTVQRIAVQGHKTRTVLLETDPKSESSKRIIPLNAEMTGLLIQLKGGKPYIFGEEKPLDPRTMQYQFKRILKEAGVDGRNFHVLRHTFATNCVENRMDVKALSEILGHSDVKITLNRYVHPTMDSKREQMETLMDFYGQICGQAA